MNSLFHLKQKAILLFLVSLLLTCAVATAQPEDGTYFIVNVATGRALAPVDAGIHSNTRLKKFDKSGMQKWVLKKYTAKNKSGKLILSYTIKNHASGFYLRPHHLPHNGNAIVSDKDAYSSCSINASGDYFTIRNIRMGGDAMYTKNTGFSDDEPWFGSAEDADTHRWKLIPAE